MVTVEHQLVAVRLDAEDLQILEALEKEERLSRSDTLRRAIRARAVELGVLPEARKPKPKK